MKKIGNITFLFLMIFIMMSAGCQRNDGVKVEYEATGAVSEYSLRYLDNSGTLQDTLVHPQSNQDKWTFRYMAEQGDIVYISGIYKDPGSGLKLMIKLDGKIYKQAANEGDTLKYLIVSGVIPYDD